jgi:hypothetical protein
MLQTQLKPAILLPTIRRKRRGLLPSSACLQRDNEPSSHSPSYRETDSGFQTRGVTPPAIFTRFGTQWFSLLLVPNRLFTRTKLQIMWRGRGGEAWLAGTATKRLIPRNLFLRGKLEEECGTWWGLHWRLMSLHCICFCNKSLCITPPVPTARKASAWASVQLWKYQRKEIQHLCTMSNCRCPFLSHTCQLSCLLDN